MGTYGYLNTCMVGTHEGTYGMGMRIIFIQRGQDGYYTICTHMGTH